MLLMLLKQGSTHEPDHVLWLGMKRWVSLEWERLAVLTEVVTWCTMTNAAPIIYFLCVSRDQVLGP